MRKLHAITIAASVCAPVIASTPVMGATKIYGELHASFDKLDADSSAVSNADTLSLNSSVLGVKGLQNVNKNLNFIYNFEVGFQSDRGVESTAEGLVNSNKDLIENRNQVIGLAGKFGAVIVGRYDTPFKTLGAKADLFWHSQLGQNRNLTNPSQWDLRADRIVVYQTPRLDGFQGTVAYSSDIGDAADSSAFSANGIYKIGDFRVGAAYERQDLDNVNAEPNAIRLMTRYQKGPLTVVGFYQNENNETEETGIADATVFGVGASYRIGKGKIKGQYYSRDVSGTSNDPDLIAIGYDYRIAKKTDVYAQFARVTEGYRLGGADHGAGVYSTTSGDADGVSLGVRYKF
ncbi:porin [Cocleimonas sp. KMM 6892]|uniref:porin n=1 Tax=unclassified Cocleimonas TaxID=2639732 RepID=UPI002DBDF1CA|nr:MULTISPECIES: porin [unclassified Cocleimonas]MEB8434075.1 porin [Cocleimonas sp. KMM 6892]MEC4717065.1 porin [Cocleimonas sp. KMM 6895]MEC4746347.1 porin [Cocleimonas sp. KMM 6896]